MVLHYGVPLYSTIIIYCVVQYKCLQIVVLGIYETHSSEVEQFTEPSLN